MHSGVVTLIFDGVARLDIPVVTLAIRNYDRLGLLL